MRPYQMQAAKAILKSIRCQEGKSFVVIISRQAGKDELAANLKAFLLARFESTEGGIVEVNPTYKPQTINAITRLDRRLNTNLITHLHWNKRSDFMRFFGKAQVSFLSGDSSANVVGAVASILLIVNEAQDIEPAIYDKNFAPDGGQHECYDACSWVHRGQAKRCLPASCEPLARCRKRTVSAACSCTRRTMSASP